MHRNRIKNILNMAFFDFWSNGDLTFGVRLVQWNTLYVSLWCMVREAHGGVVYGTASVVERITSRDCIADNGILVYISFLYMFGNVKPPPFNFQ